MGKLCWLKLRLFVMLLELRCHRLVLVPVGIMDVIPLFLRSTHSIVLLVLTSITSMALLVRI